MCQETYLHLVDTKRNIVVLNIFTVIFKHLNLKIKLLFSILHFIRLIFLFRILTIVFVEYTIKIQVLFEVS